MHVKMYYINVIYVVYGGSSGAFICLHSFAYGYMYMLLVTTETKSYLNIFEYIVSSYAY